ncbi:phosphoketolase family protein, partial [bacterium]|nr:phosphoketolase family protein [bacterium]
HAQGAAFDNPDLIAVAVIGDGEAETGPLAGSWKGTTFLNPVRDGAVLPILHLNGYKISGPTVMGRWPDGDIAELLEANGYAVQFVEGDDPATMHQAFAAALDAAYARIRSIQGEARSHGLSQRPRWPAIVLRSPKGWTGPVEVDGEPVAGTFRSHQVPLANVRSEPEHLILLERWMHSYRPEELFDDAGKPIEEIRSLAPAGERRMSANPHANGGVLLDDLGIPDYRSEAIDVARPGAEFHESTRQLGKLTARLYAANPTTFRLFCPDELNSNRFSDVFKTEQRCFVGETVNVDEAVSPDGRVMEVLSEHLCEGWLEGYLLTGRHGLYVTYEAFAMISASMMVQHTKWLSAAEQLPWRKPIASLNTLLTSTCWRNDHNGFSHQGPGLIDVLLSKRGTVSRIYLPPDANCLLSVADHCLRSRDYVNLIVIDKQPQLQWLDIDAASAHCARGASTWEWAGNTVGEPDVVLASAGDIPTLETLAAAAWLRANAPDLKVRVVNVVDLMTLFLPHVHPHGMPDGRFEELFTHDRPVIFAFHGYQRAIHEIIHGRPNPERFHVRGFREQGTTTTPFDMVVLNEMSRYHLAGEALRRTWGVESMALQQRCKDEIAAATVYSHQHFEDPPAIRDWTWDRAVSGK